MRTFPSSTRLFLFSGMAGDRRLFSALRLPGIALVTPDHLEPSAAEDLPGYARRLAAHHGIRDGDVIGGASFGGMLAAQIASERPVAGLILLGSCHKPQALIRKYRWTEFLGRFVPDPFLRVRSWKPFMRWRFGAMTPEAERCLAEMAETYPPLLLRRFARMFVHWEGAPAPACPRLVIHGAKDRMIPLSCAEPDLVFPDAGHIFTLTHPEQTSAAILRFLEGAS